MLGTGRRYRLLYRIAIGVKECICTVRVCKYALLCICAIRRGINACGCQYRVKR